MRALFSPGVLQSLLAGFVLSIAATATAQVNPSDLEPRWMRLDIPQASTAVEMEGFSEDVSVRGANYTHERYSLIPLLGVRSRGSIYHPNLLSFDLNGEAGWGWMSDTVKGDGPKVSRSESQDLQRYIANINFLSGKPYNASFYATQDHTYRNLDPFNSYTVDSLRYGGRLNWITRYLSMHADAGFRDETSTGLSSSTHVSETFFNFNGTFKRQTGQSSLGYRYNEFDNVVNGGGHQNSVNNTVTVSDSETFGSRQQITATTGGSFSRYEYSGKQTETVTANENVTVKHTPTLDSFALANYSHSSMDSASSSFLLGSTGIRHRLYESLVSTLDVHGAYNEATSPSSTTTHDRFGVGLQEDYTKRLGSWGRLSVGGGVNVNHEDSRSSGAIVTVIDEVHTLHRTTSPNYRPAYLNNPRVIRSTIEVRGPGGVPVLENTDYELIPSGELIEIRLMPTGSPLLNDGDTVTVSYQSESLYEASFESLGASLQIRLDLFNTFGIYIRGNWLDNNAPPDVLAQTLTDLVAGADVMWRGFRAGAEYEDYNSNFNRYQACRFFQGYSLRPTDVSTLSVDLGETFYQYPDNRNQTQYSIISRFNTQLTPSLAWYLEGGYTIQNQFGTDQSFGSARTGLTWTRDKLSVRAGYQYNYQTIGSNRGAEERMRHYLYIYLKRAF